MSRRFPPTAEFADAVRSGDRTALARAITLVESTKPAHQALAQDLLVALLPDTGKAHRVGITGLPGVGKSTSIDQLGTNLTKAGHKVAVLAVDPSSTRTGGSILGDKTRMERLSVDPQAFIRPSPSSGTLGGVTRTTRETMLVCEAAGFDVILVETVGVGQSETIVSEMVDFFLVLMLPGGGDELQGIKKGVLEIADMIAINKADGDNEARARMTAADYRAALRIITPASAPWQPPVHMISGLKNIGLDVLWAEIEKHHVMMEKSGALQAKRADQMVRWMWAMLKDRLLADLLHDEGVAARLPALESAVRSGAITPTLAVTELLDQFEGKVNRPG